MADSPTAPLTPSAARQVNHQRNGELHSGATPLQSVTLPNDEKLSVVGGDDGTEESTTPVPSRTSHRSVPMCSLFRFATFGDRCLMLLGAVAAVIGGCGIPLICFIFGRLLDDLVDSSQVRDKTARMAMWLAIVGAGLGVAAGIYVWTWTVAASRQAATLRRRYFESTLRQDIGWHDVHSPGELTARMTGDTRVFQNGINDKLSHGLYNFSMGLIGYVFGLFLCWELSLLMFGVMPFMILAGALLSSVMMRVAERSREHYAEAGSMATEVMENIRTVQTFGREEFEVERFHVAVSAAEKDGIQKEFLNGLTSGVVMMLMFVSYAVAFFFSTFLLRSGRSGMGDVIATFFCVLVGSFGFSFVPGSLAAFNESRSAAFEIYCTIDRVPPVDVEAPGKDIHAFEQCIEFRDVKFAYPSRPDDILFQKLNLTIRRGQKVALSGASGCGKSSLIGLIQRFYDPLDGTVRVDGVPLTELHLPSWRKHIGIVSQEPNLFEGSMLDNVRMGAKAFSDIEPTLEEVMEACKQANIHDTIMSLPDQYHTAVGAVGSQLSGGQKQRIAIARALVKRPAILILDEATSALDRKSEVEVQAALDELMCRGGVTIILIAHRLATIRDVDCIYYFHHDDVAGTVIRESGTFEELMAQQGAFAAMASAQGAIPASRTRSPIPRFASPVTATAVRLASSPNAAAPPPDVVLGEEDFKAMEANETERQRVPLESQAHWEVEQTQVSMWRILKLNRPHLWALLCGLSGSIITGGIRGPVQGILISQMIRIFGDYAISSDKGELQAQTNLYAPLFLVVGVGAVVGWLLQSFYGYAGERLTTKLRTLLYRNILRQDMSFFDIPGRDAGSLAGMLSGDCEAVHQLWGPSMGLKVQMFSTAGLGVLVGFFYQWKLALVASACVPIMIVSTVMQQKLMTGLVGAPSEEDAGDRIVTESLSNVRTVTSFHLKEDRVRAYHAVQDKTLPREIRQGTWMGLLYGITKFAISGCYPLCYWYGGILISNGEATFEQVVTVCTAVLMSAEGAGEAGSYASKASDAEASARRVYSVIDRVPDVDVEAILPAADGQLRFASNADAAKGWEMDFTGVQFLYPSRPRLVVLDGADIAFAAGTSNGLIGPTGCGKSTMLQILARFYPWRAGRVTVNGTDLASLPISTWRAHLSVVLQEPNLFRGSVRENIRYARAEASNDEVEEAAKLAGIHEEIRGWPEGYDTNVGYKGRSLSGGQKQRVAIARGLLRHPKLLLLDEATSALDNVTEAKVQANIEAFQRAHPEMSTISIAHRLTTIRRCDQILVMEGGHVLERGSHDALMAAKGVYHKSYELYHQQSQEEAS